MAAKQKTLADTRAFPNSAFNNTKKSAFKSTQKLAGHHKFSIVVDTHQLARAKSLYPAVRSRSELLRLALDYLLERNPKLVTVEPHFEETNG